MGRNVYLKKIHNLFEVLELNCILRQLRTNIRSDWSGLHFWIILYLDSRVSCILIWRDADNPEVYKFHVFAKMSIDIAAKKQKIVTTQVPF